MQEQWKTVILPRGKWYRFPLKELWLYRELIGLTVKRNFKVTYQQTILGPLWIILMPLITTLIFTVVFGNIARLPTDGAPQFLFYMLGNNVWSLFSSAAQRNSLTLLANRNIFDKVYFPRLIMPISETFSVFLNFCIQFAIFLLFWGYSLFRGEVSPNYALFALIPILFLILLALGMGVGSIISSLTVKYRDLQVMVTFGLQLWMYVTPVVYPISGTGGLTRALLMINPVTPIVEAFRFIFFGSGVIYTGYLALSACTALAVLFLGLFLFHRAEKNFIDNL